jgi:hypothetical protein
MINWLTPWHLNFFLGLFLALQSGLFFYFETTRGVTDRQDRIRGRDFLHFYLAGRLVAEGQSDRLYDQERFVALQRSISPIDEKNPPYWSIYPPHSALLFSVLGKLPYPRAVECWWLIQLICVIASVWILIRQLEPPQEWYITAWLGGLAFYPVINIFWNGQVAALLLLFAVVGFAAHRQQRYLLAGLVFSLLSLKPHLALCTYIWLLLRGDWRTLLGVAVGGVIQLGLVAGLMGPEVLLHYLQNSKLASSIYVLYTMSPDHQHALAGILTTLLGASYSTLAMCAQGIIAIITGYWLWKLRRTTYEYPAAILFVLNSAPHLLTYDMSLVLIAITYLLIQYKTDARLLTPICLLYGSAMLAPLYVATYASLVPVAMFVVSGWLVWLYRSPSRETNRAVLP